MKGISPGRGQVAEQSGKGVLIGGHESSTSDTFSSFYTKYYTPSMCVLSRESLGYNSLVM